MFPNLLSFAESFVSSFGDTHEIRHSTTGAEADAETKRQVRHLPDRLLRDIGFDRSA